MAASALKVVQPDSQQLTSGPPEKVKESEGGWSDGRGETFRMGNGLKNRNQRDRKTISK